MSKSEEKTYLKPKLGRTVYCIYHDACIFTSTVAFLGEDSFIVDSFNNCTNEDSWEWSYGCYNLDWFTNLAKAKKYLRELLEETEGREFKIVKVDNDYYEAREKGE